MNRLALFVRFAGLSGLGWLFDITVLLILVGFGVRAFNASIISASIAALSVFLVSRHFVFERDKRALGARLVIYLSYTICVILVAAATIQQLVNVFGSVVASHHFGITRTTMAAVAKIIVTPPQLLLNFVVARALSERSIGRSA